MSHFIWRCIAELYFGTPNGQALTQLRQSRQRGEQGGKEEQVLGADVHRQPRPEEVEPRERRADVLVGECAVERAEQFVQLRVIHRE